MIVLYQLFSAGDNDVPREHPATSGNIFGHSQGGVTGIQWVETTANSPSPASMVSMVP